MTGTVTRVREVPNVGFEVVRVSQRGRLSIAFRRHAAEANEIAREAFEMERNAMLLNPDGPAPRLELWEPAG